MLLFGNALELFTLSFSFFKFLSKNNYWKTFALTKSLASIENDETAFSM